MSRSFLPASSSDYAFPNPIHRELFSAQPDSVLQDIPSKMDFTIGTTQGRLPSPFSRAYHFYFSLTGRSLDPANMGAANEDDEGPSEARELLKAKARAAFRGICAAFALRKDYDLEIELRQSSKVRGGQQLPKHLFTFLSRHYEGDKHAESWDPFVYYFLNGGTGRPNGVLAGFSPLTGFFPAAKSVPELQCLYWYNQNRVTREWDWNDPTAAEWYHDGDQKWGDPRDAEQLSWRALNPKERNEVLLKLQAWLEKICAYFASRDGDQELVDLGITATPDLRDEFDMWKDELSYLGVPTQGRVESESLPRDERAERDNTRGLPFLDYYCLPSHDHVTELQITRQELLDPKFNIRGIHHGRPEYESRIPELDLRGDNLGLALGLTENALPVPYIFLNRLFTKYLTPITDNGFSDEWNGLILKEEGVETTHFYPFDPDVLQFASVEEIRGTTIESIETDRFESFKVSLKFANGKTISQVYTDRPETASEATGHYLNFDIKEQLDLRFFPNFDLEPLRLEDDVLSEDDLKYYARARLSSSWLGGQSAAKSKKFIRPLLLPADPGVQDQYDWYRTEDSGNHNSGDIARYFVLEDKPIAFSMERRGICFLDLELPEAVRTDLPPFRWDLAIDFGTSNTCVAQYTVASKRAPVVLRLPVLTTRLLKLPSYQDAAEGMAAVLDFFYNFGGTREEEHLYPLDYFPTQITTQLPEPPAGGQLAKFNIRNGLIFFQNISKIAFFTPYIAGLVRGFCQHAGSEGAQAGGRAPTPLFRLETDLKWTNQEWLYVFMHHLRRQIVMTAARENARISRVFASFPKGHTKNDIEQFLGHIKAVWTDVKVKSFSESEAAQEYLVRAGGIDNNYIVDVGAGTSDVLCYVRGTPVYQTSLRLAGKYVDNYVVSSRPFRETIRRALGLPNVGGSEIDLSLGLERSGFFEQIAISHAEERLSESQAQGVSSWQGLLHQVDEAVAADRPGDLAGLRQFHDSLRSPQLLKASDEQGEDAIRGFYLTLTLLYSGLSYLGGLMQRFLPAEERSGTMTITLLGNGAKYYQFLNTPDSGMDEVLAALFKAAANPPDRDESVSQVSFLGIIDGEKDSPKSAVAKGMLMPEKDGNRSVGPPVRNLVLENVALGEETSVDAGDSLSIFYQKLVDTKKLEVGESDSLFVDFLTTLGSLLPKGERNEYTVIPAADRNWESKLIGYVKSSTFKSAVKDRLISYAKDHASDLHDDGGKSAVALDPVFIIELATLLDRIKQTGGNV